MIKEDLIKFEEKVCQSFINKEIRSPIHLYDGNEDIMIDLFKSIKSDDWIFCTWRSHYQCLLKGIPEDKLLNDIRKGKSISLCYPEYRIYSTAIVGGNIPIANGVAFDIKRKKLDNTVWCFLGDMASETGCFHENYKYSVNFDLPITWVIEDNGRSTCTDTKKTWNVTKTTYENKQVPKVIYYKYIPKYPHSGTGGARITF